MNAIHSDPSVIEMATELPMRRDLAKRPLDANRDIAQAQLLMRQAVPLPLHEILVNKIKGLLKSVFHN